MSLATELHTQLMGLVERHTLEGVVAALATIREVPSAPRPGGKSAKYAATYEGTLITDTERAILWWTPSRGEANAHTGQAAWIPRVLVLDITPSGDASALDVLRTTRPVGWRYATRTGSTIRFEGVRS